MSGERRTSQRLSFEHEESPDLALDLDGKRVVAHVLDIAEGGMLIALPASTDPTALQPNTLLSNTVLFQPPNAQVELEGLEVLDTSYGDEEHVHVRLHAELPATRAKLWLAMESTRSEGARLQAEREFLPRDKVPRVPARGIYTESARIDQLNFMREVSGAPLMHMQHSTLIAEKLTGNIEHLIGGVEVPVGLAGPLLFHGQRAQGFIYAPFATTEGALVASASRGATAITRSGGVSTRVISQRMMRVPFFIMADMQGAFLFASWVRDHIPQLRDEVRKVSAHANLVSVEPHLIGNMVHVSFLYETGDAAGQNMTTSATWHGCQWLMHQMDHYPDIRFDRFFLDGNMSGDKKVTFKSFISGRGTRVTAECFLHAKICEEVLKTTPLQLVKCNQWSMAAAIQTGTVGYNINIANVVAAMFTATGQDIASVHESSVGVLSMETVEDGIHVNLLLPGIIVGTVGGGTHLPRQNELLQVMDCAGPGKASRLAEIIAGYCLALDLSTMSAMATGQFARAHERLGRNRPVQWLGPRDLVPHFFEPGLRRVLNDTQAHLLSVRPLTDVPMGTSIISEMTARKVQKLIGLFPLRLHYQSQGKDAQVDVVAKVKPLDAEVILMGNSMAGMCGAKLAAAHNRYKEWLGSSHCHLRELGIAQQTDPRFTNHMPQVYQTFRDDEREAYVIVSERLQDMHLMDQVDDITPWGRPEIEAALHGAAQFHSVWYGREQELRKTWWLGDKVHSAESMTQMSPLWEALGVHAAEEFPEWVDERDLNLHRGLVQLIPDWWARIDQQTKTLIHNDFNPRNICLRKVHGGLRLCAYDWELATLHLPQHDMAELLCFVLTPTATLDEVDHYVEFHRQALEKAVGRPLDAELWRDGYRHCLYDLVINRIALYVMAHTFRHYPFMERVVRTLRNLIRLEKDI